MGAAIAGALRRHPLAALVAGIGGAGVALALLVVLGEAGALVLLLVGVALLARVAWAPPEQRLARCEHLVRGLATTVTVLLLALGTSELWLRAHPERVGGGGGGNPALATLYDGLYRYNALGLRGPEIAPHRGAGTTRILAVGDSFTFGQGVAEEHTWPAQLEARLDARAAARGATDTTDASGAPASRATPDARDLFEVVNAGRPGLDTRGELEWLQAHAPALAPDVVIVQFYVNDVIVHREIGSAPRSPVAAIMTGAQRHVWTLFVLRERVDALRRGLAHGAAAAPPDWRAVFAHGVERGGPGWRDCADAIDALGAWAAGARRPLLMVLYPHPGPPHPGTAVVHAAVAARAAQAGLAVLDLAGRLADVPPARQIAHDYDHHPGPDLHARAAELVADELVRLGWIR